MVRTHRPGHCQLCGRHDECITGAAHLLQALMRLLHVPSTDSESCVLFAGKLRFRPVPQVTLQQQLPGAPPAALALLKRLLRLDPGQNCSFACSPV